jgi:hypothetical protein
MDPAAVVLPDELGEAYATFVAHVDNHIEQTAVVGTIATDDVGGTAESVVTVLDTSKEFVELLAAIATADHNWFTPRLAYGVEELFYQYM